jgi:hypothetical protein
MRVDAALIRSFATSAVRYVGGTLLAANLLFPPWIYTFQSQGISRVTIPAGYAAVFAPPEPRTSGYIHGVSIDVTRLVVQTLAISLALMMAGLGLRSRKGPASDLEDSSEREPRNHGPDEPVSNIASTDRQRGPLPTSQADDLTGDADRMKAGRMKRLWALSAAGRCGDQAELATSSQSPIVRPATEAPSPTSSQSSLIRRSWESS